MQYISDSENRSRLGQSRNGKPWMVISFYFDFRAGTAKANNLSGLLKSYLRQLVQASSKAKAAVEEDPRGRNLVIKNYEPDQKTLLCLIQLCIRAIAGHYSVCAFIDGLDEFRGDYAVLLRLVDSLNQNGIEKLVLACRPENILKLKLARRPDLKAFKMQDHNMHSIENYVREEIEMAFQEAGIAMDASTVVHQIIAGAQGVIIWARLVTTEIVNDILSGASEEEVFQKVNGYPSELDELYGRLFANLNRANSLETAAMLYFIRTARAEITTIWDLLCAMRFLRHFGCLPSWPQTLDLKAFTLRLSARLGSTVDLFYDDHVGFAIYPLQNEEEPNRTRLFHKTLNDYLDGRQWDNDILRRVIPDMQLAHPWLYISLKCVFQINISVDECELVTKLCDMDNPSESCLEEAALSISQSKRVQATAIARALRCLQVEDNGLALLPHALLEVVAAVHGGAFDTVSADHEIRKAMATPVITLCVTAARLLSY